MPSSIDAFTQACKERGMRKPSSAIKKILVEDELLALEELPLDDVYVGNRGLMALLDVIEKAPNFRNLNLASQKLYNGDLSPDSVKGNEVVDRVVEVATHHPKLTSIDLSRNPLSNFAGRKLLQLVTSNKRILGISLEDTRIDNDLLDHINIRCDKNLKVYWEKKNDTECGEPDDEGEFGTAQFVHPQEKAPCLQGIGGGVRKRTVMGVSTDKNKVKAFKARVIPKDAEDESLIWDLLRDNLLFSHLDRNTMKVVVGACIKRSFAKGDKPIEEGDEGNTLYIIVKGTCNVLKRGMLVCQKAERTVFGELEIMYSTPCVATIQVDSEELVVFCLDRDTYANLVVGYSIKKREEYEEYLGRVEFLSTLSTYEKLQLSDAMTTDEYEEGEYIIRHGDIGEWMFLVVSGVVEVIGRTQGIQSNVCEFKEGDHFGELEFLNNHPCVADVRAKTHVRTAKVNRKHFESCFGPVLHILKRNVQDPTYEYYKKQLELAGVDQ